MDYTNFAYGKLAKLTFKYRLIMYFSEKAASQNLVPKGSNLKFDAYIYSIFFLLQQFMAEALTLFHSWGIGYAHNVGSSTKRFTFFFHHCLYVVQSFR